MGLDLCSGCILQAPPAAGPLTQAPPWGEAPPLASRLMEGRGNTTVLTAMWGLDLGPCQASQLLHRGLVVPSLAVTPGPSCCQHCGFGNRAGALWLPMGFSAVPVLALVGAWAAVHKCGDIRGPLPRGSGFCAHWATCTQVKSSSVTGPCPCAATPLLSTGGNQPLGLTQWLRAGGYPGGPAVSWAMTPQPWIWAPNLLQQPGGSGSRAMYMLGPQGFSLCVLAGALLPSPGPSSSGQGGVTLPRAPGGIKLHRAEIKPEWDRKARAFVCPQG